eukprot:11270132-Karenia_brevis.AAC.1
MSLDPFQCRSEFLVQLTCTAGSAPGPDDLGGHCSEPTGALLLREYQPSSDRRSFRGLEAPPPKHLVDLH